MFVRLNAPFTHLSPRPHALLYKSSKKHFISFLGKWNKHEGFCCSDKVYLCDNYRISNLDKLADRMHKTKCGTKRARARRQSTLVADRKLNTSKRWKCTIVHLTQGEGRRTPWTGHHCDTSEWPVNLTRMSSGFERTQTPDSRSESLNPHQPLHHPHHVEDIYRPAVFAPQSVYVQKLRMKLKRVCFCHIFIGDICMFYYYFILKTDKIDC